MRQAAAVELERLVSSAAGRASVERAASRARCPPESRAAAGARCSRGARARAGVAVVAPEPSAGETARRRVFGQQAPGGGGGGGSRFFTHATSGREALVGVEDDARGRTRHYA